MLRVFDRMEDHNLKRLLDRGLRVTVNSDDPAYFGGYIGENYRAVQRALGLDRADIARLARNSFEASFLPIGERREWIAKVDAFAASHAA
jgi:adenosine deaminase